MKKILVIAGIAVLALAVAACTLFDDPNGQSESREIFDEQGRRLRDISIDTGDGGARNMSQEMAQAAINYYEVVFKDGTQYIRAAGPRGKILIVRLAEGVGGQPLYGVDNAVVFAGYWDKDADQRTLLAVGNVTHTNWGEGASQTTVVAGNTVMPTTVNIRFQLSAVKTRFDTVADSSFKITAPTPTAYVTGGVGGIDDTAHIANHILVNNKMTPVYKLPPATVALGSGSTARGASFVYDVGGHNAGIHTVMPDTIGTGTPSGPGFVSWSLIPADDPDAGLVICRALLNGATETALTPVAPGDAVPLPATIGLLIYTGLRPSANGFVMIFPNFTVYPINAAASNPTNVRSGGPAEPWGLRNGIHFYLPHDNQAWWDSEDGPLGVGGGRTPLDSSSLGGSSLGGGIVLQVGESSGSGGRIIRIIIDGPPPT